MERSGVKSRQAGLLQDVFDELVPRSGDFSRAFFERLSVLEPGIGPADVETIDGLTGRFISTLATIISELKHPDRVLPLLNELVDRYLGESPTATDFHRVHAAFSWALVKSLGADFTSEIDRACCAASSMLIGRLLQDRRSGGADIQTSRLQQFLGAENVA